MQAWPAAWTSSSCATRDHPASSGSALEARGELAACEILADAARRHGALLAVNDRADIARAAGADVLHLGQDDLPLAVARDIVGPTTLIGRSTHETGEASGR
jgi:thiamine-phosphate pyrophosphorylase